MPRPACALLLCLAAAAPVAPRPPAPACPPSPATGEALNLFHLEAALRPGTLWVAAIGSANAFAAATQDSAAPMAGKSAVAARPTAMPVQFANALEAALPGLHVNLTLLGDRGLTASQMLARLQTELPRHPYRLVLWQTGTVEAVQDLPPDDFYQTLADGAAFMSALGADVVLIDPQYSRFLEANANLQPYFGALQAAGALPGVGLFHRFDTMRAWAQDPAFDLEDSAKADRPAVAGRLHACLAAALLRQVLLR